MCSPGSRFLRKVLELPKKVSSSAAVRYLTWKGIPSLVAKRRKEAERTRPLFGPDFHTLTPSQCSILSDVSKDAQHSRAWLIAIRARESPLIPISMASAAAWEISSPRLDTSVWASAGSKATLVERGSWVKLSPHSKCRVTLRGRAPLSSTSSGIVQESHSLSCSGISTLKGRLASTTTSKLRSSRGA